MLKMLLAGAATLAVATAANAETYAIQAGHLIVDAAQPERGASTVIVENGRIARVENGFTAPAGAIVVDQRNRTVMPGMTDVHVHLTDTSGEPWYAGSTQKRSVPYAATVGLTHALETARGGILREGVGWDRCEVGCVLNISADHLGLRGVDTLEDLATVKQLVVELVLDNGASVLRSSSCCVIRTHLPDELPLVRL